MYHTYILYSRVLDKYYIGYTANLSLRLTRHNSGNSISTKAGCPWNLLYSESFETKREAIVREKQIKRMKSRIYIETLIAGGRPDEIGKPRPDR